MWLKWKNLFLLHKLELQHECKTNSTKHLQGMGTVSPVCVTEIKTTSGSKNNQKGFHVFVSVWTTASLANIIKGFLGFIPNLLKYV